VCPDNRATWDGGLITTILEETLALAQIRAVDLSSLQQLGQFFPALLFPFNLQATTPTAQFLATGAEEIAHGDL
jgi:hypothetical protein